MRCSRTWGNGRSLAVIAAAGLVLAACTNGDTGSDGATEGSDAATQAADEALQPLTINHWAGVDISLPTWIGVEAGIYEGCGFDVSLVSVESGPVAMAALESGDMDFVMNQTPAFLSMAQDGVATYGVAGNVAWYPFTIIARPDLEMPNAGTFPDALADLEGLTFGVDAIGGVTQNVLMSVFDANGYDPENHVKFVAVGDTAALQQAFQNGDVDAFMALPREVFQMVELGDEAQAVLDMGEAEQFQPWVLNMWGATQERVEELGDETVGAFRDCNGEVLDYMLDPANEEEVAGFTSEYLGIDEGNAMDFVNRLVPLMSPEISEEAVRNVVDFQVENDLLDGAVDVEGFVWSG